ncbi:MAG: Ig-like domain-containing protein [Candidatus Nitrotoga sp.]
MAKRGEMTIPTNTHGTQTVLSPRAKIIKQTKRKVIDPDDLPQNEVTSDTQLAQNQPPPKITPGNEPKAGAIDPAGSEVAGSGGGGGFSMTKVIGVVGGVSISTGDALAIGSGVAVFTLLGSNTPAPRPVNTAALLSAPDLNIDSDSGSSTTDNITSDATPTVSGSGAKSGATVTLYDTNGTTVLGATTAAVDGTWSITASNINNTALTDGVHTLTVKQTAGNISPASASLAVTIDTVNPTVISVTANNLVITDSNVGTGTFNIAVTFSEAMNITAGATPVLSFSPAVSSTLTQNGAGVWSVGNTVYTVTYNVADVNLVERNITVDVTGAQDIAGNAQQNYRPATEFSINTIAPSVLVNIVDLSLNNTDSSSPVTFTFSEVPTNFTVADITSVGGLITSFTSTTNSLVYTATFTATDAFSGTGSVTVGTAWQDAAGNTGVGGSDTVAIGTVNPTVANVTANDLVITDSNVGTGTFNIAVTFSEAMNTATTPTLSFGTNVSSTLTLTGGVWSTGNTIYTATYNVTDANLLTNGVTVDVTGAQDANGNAQQDYTALAEFSIDTLNPTVTVNIVDVSLNNTNNSSLVTFTFSEVPTNFTVADITSVGGLITSFTPTNNSLVYTATFTATDSFSGTGSVTVGTAWQDATGNTGVDGSDTVAIDTLINPTVTINAVATDDIINAAERTATVTVTGTNDAGSTVTLNGNATTAVTATTWSYVLSEADITTMGEGAETLTAVATDAVGNTASATRNITVDTVNPTVISVTANDLVITDANVGTATFNIAVTFSEAMNTGVTPILVFSPAVSSTLTQDGVGVWSLGNIVYTVTYNVADVNLVERNITVDVTDAQDVNGNAQQDYTAAAEFSIVTVTTIGTDGDDSIQYYNLARLTLNSGENAVAGDTLLMPGTEVATVNLASADQTTGDNTIVNNFENVDASAATVSVNLTGSEKANVLTGGSGADTITGDRGADNLFGGGADSLFGGRNNDTFIFTAGNSGQTTGTIDVIGDYAKNSVGVGDVIDYSSALAIGGSDAIASANEASIDAATGVATFNTDSGTTLDDALADIATRFTAATDTAGEFATFQVNGTGDYYLFISDGDAGVTANDVVVQLSGVTTINTIDLTGANLTILT